MAVTNLMIGIGAEYKGRGAFKQAETATQKLTKSVRNLAGAFGIAFGTQAVVNFARSSIRAFKESEAQQQRLARKQKGSANREKARKKLNKTHRKIKNQRRDFIHKVSNQIAKGYIFVAVEDLNVKGMVKNKRLAKAISDQGWTIFVNQLEYKSASKGGCTVKIDRFAPSSKTCSSCGHVQPMPLSVRTYECGSCGYTEDRDVNAAVNIKNWGIVEINRCGTHRIHACGDTNNGGSVRTDPSYVSLKQEKFFSFGEEATTPLGS
jgi:putative transposase